LNLYTIILVLIYIELIILSNLVGFFILRFGFDGLIYFGEKMHIFW